jgi:hypothetical protein
MGGTVPVSEVAAGRRFRKQQGSQWFVRISDSSAKAVGLDVREHVYGVCNGNILAIKRSTPVVLEEKC